MFLYIYIYLCIYFLKNIYTCIYIYISVCIYIYIYICIYIYIYSYTYLYMSFWLKCIRSKQGTDVGLAHAQQLCAALSLKDSTYARARAAATNLDASSRKVVAPHRLAANRPRSTLRGAE